MHERADSAGGRRAVVFVGAQQDGGAMGAGDDGKRNAVEQWFSIFKQHVKWFYKRWPHDACVETAASWCEAFVALYNLKGA